MRFDDSPTSVAAARRFVAEALVLGGRPELAPKVSLVVSELATNVIRHARTPYDVEVRVDGDLWVAVTDTGPGTPVRRRVDIESRTGRGLAIVESLCTEWGVESRAPGKRVWCSIEGENGAASAALATEAAPGSTPGS